MINIFFFSSFIKFVEEDSLRRAYEKSPSNTNLVVIVCILLLHVAIGEEKVINANDYIRI